jgi:two-component system, sensor histidine kinase and response regulator
MDVMMPEMNGYEACEQIRNIKGYSDIPIIFLTGVTDVESKVRAFEAGGQDYVTKPFNRIELLQRINTHLKIKAGVDKIRSINTKLGYEIKQREQIEILLKELNETLESRVRDRTKEVERLLVQKNAFIRQLGHDLKTPLTPIITLSRMIVKKTEDERSLKMLDVIERNACYMNNLVHTILRHARLGSSSLTLNIEEFDIISMIDRLIDDLKPSCKQKGIEIENLSTGKCVIEADVLLIREVFENLMSNALKYIPDGKRAQFRVASENDMVTVLLSDNGSGLSPEQVSKLFDEFYKTDDSRGNRESTGLGLSICKKIIEKHGGNISVESDGIGQGCTFTIELPV